MTADRQAWDDVSATYKRVLDRLTKYSAKPEFRDFVRRGQIDHLIWRRSHLAKIREKHDEHERMLRQPNITGSAANLVVHLARTKRSGKFFEIVDEINALQGDPRYTLVSIDGPDGVSLSQRCLEAAKFLYAATGSMLLWSMSARVKDDVQLLIGECIAPSLADEESDLATVLRAEFPQIEAIVESLIAEFDRTPGSDSSVVTKLEVDDSEPNPDALPKSERQAYWAFKHAQDAMERELTDKEAWDWLKSNDESSYELPDFKTFGRYLRRARQSLGQQKNRSRTSRDGRSIASARDL